MFGRRKTIGAWLKEIFASGRTVEGLYDELEDKLIEGDIGPLAAQEIVAELKGEPGKGQLQDRDALTERLRLVLRGYVRAHRLEIESGKLNVFLVLGVNGVGKTTTIAKLADFFRQQNQSTRILFSAADTYRAAAIDQLKILGDRLGLPVISQDSGADPAAVIFDSISSAYARGVEAVLADTAGRMHNKANLVKELQKVDKVVQRRVGSGRYSKVLVVDATTGQNGLQQAETFHEAVGVDSIILAKYDSTAKGGVAVSICRRLGIPISFLGTGERAADLVPFDSARYVDSLLGIDEK